jgi:hypothetical protein
MPQPLATAFFIFAAFLLTVSSLAAILVAGVGLAVQLIAFFLLAGARSAPQERTVTLPREFDVADG